MASEPTAKKAFTATKFRILLACLLFILAGGGGAGFFYGYQVVDEFADQVSRAKADEVASEKTLTTLSTLEAQMQQNAATIDSLGQFYITSELPQFRAITEVRNYASRHNFPVQSITFVASGTTTPTTTQTPTAPTTTLTAPSGGKYISVVLTLSGDISYQQLLEFLQDTEQSLPYMKVGGVSLTASGQNIKVNPITIEVLAR